MNDTLRLISFLFAVISSTLFLANPTFATLTLQVEPKTTECFGVDVQTTPQRVAVTFLVLRGGLLDIDLRIYGPKNEQVYSGLQFETSEYVFVANTPGPYQVCWNNEMARWTAKVVQFDIHLGESSATDPLTKQTLSPMEESVKRIGQSLDAVTTDQRFLRLREQSHRDTAESTNTRVLWYSILESFLLIGISLGQVYYLRKFFEIKRVV